MGYLKGLHESLGSLNIFEKAVASAGVLSFLANNVIPTLEYILENTVYCDSEDVIDIWTTLVDNGAENFILNDLFDKAHYLIDLAGGYECFKVNGIFNPEDFYAEVRDFLLENQLPQKYFGKYEVHHKTWVQVVEATYEAQVENLE